MLDTGSGNTVIGRNLLLKLQPEVLIKPLRYPFVTGSVVDGADEVNGYYASVNIYFDAVIGRRQVKAHVDPDILVSDVMADDLLLGMDLIKRHGIVVDPRKDHVVITKCNNARVHVSYDFKYYSQLEEDAEEAKRVEEVRLKLESSMIRTSSESMPSPGV